MEVNWAGKDTTEKKIVETPDSLYLMNDSSFPLGILDRKDRLEDYMLRVDVP